MIDKDAGEQHVQGNDQTAEQCNDFNSFYYWHRLPLPLIDTPPVVDDDSVWRDSESDKRKQESSNYQCYYAAKFDDRRALESHLPVTRSPPSTPAIAASASLLLDRAVCMSCPPAPPPPTATGTTCSGIGGSGLITTTRFLGPGPASPNLATPLPMRSMSTLTTPTMPSVNSAADGIKLLISWRGTCLTDSIAQSPTSPTTSSATSNNNVQDKHHRVLKKSNF